MSNKTSKEIGALAKDYWMNRLEMAEPKYCANGSWGYFLDGFTFGYEHKIQPFQEQLKAQAEEIEKLKSELEIVEHARQGWAHDAVEAQKQIERLKADREKLVEMGKFYANPESWVRGKNDGNMAIRSIDREHLNPFNYGGKRARQTLKSIGEIE